MTLALLCTAAALLVWPGRQRRLARPAVPGRAARHRALLPAPLPAAAAAALVGALASTPLVAGLAAVCAALAARAWQRRRRSAREEARLLALTEALEVLAAELRSGRPLAAALRTASAGCSDAGTAQALAAAVAVPAAGPPESGRDEPTDGPLGAALRRVAAAAQLSARTGCSLDAVVTAVEGDLRARRRALLELQSATAAPRTSAGLLAGLPLLGLAMGSGIGADPWGVLTTSGVGQVLLVAGVGLEIAGVAWVARLVRAAVP